jgi:ABC-type metal ion transport system, periplasmic component/surface adhesin
MVRILSRNKILGVTFSFLAVALIIIGIFHPLYVYGQREKIQVALTHPTLYSLVKILGGDYVDVVNIIPPGVDPHEYEPPVDVIKRIGSSDIIYIDALHHLPVSDRIYSLYPDKTVVLLNELIARGWVPDKLIGTDSENLHEFLLDKKAMLMAINIVGETLANIAGRKGYSEAELYIKSNTDSAKRIFEEAYNKARSFVALSGVNSVALYSPVPYYLVKSLGINISIILTPDPEVEPHPQELQRLSLVGAKCLVISSDAEHIDSVRLETSIKSLGIKVADLGILSYENPWSLPFLPLLTAILISRCILNADFAAQAVTEYRGDLSMLPNILLGAVIGLLIGIILTTIYRGGRRRSY